MTYLTEEGYLLKYTNSDQTSLISDICVKDAFIICDNYIVAWNQDKVSIYNEDNLKVRKI